MPDLANTITDAPTSSAHAARNPPEADRDSTPAAPESCQPIVDLIRETQAAVLELRVRNHSGTLSHIAGLFARRGFNLDAVLCVPEPGAPEFSRMWLRLAEEPRLDQVERQLAKLYDVLEIRHRTDIDPEFFRWLGKKD